MGSRAWSITFVLDPVILSPGYRLSLRGLAGKVHKVSAVGKASPDMVFVGASEPKQVEGGMEITYNFAAGDECPSIASS